ncbi:uncharacterized protein TNIN_339091 [Trichonephila inaurata madagascariensis]|uniref:Uncharacterized protein n=1 Tax=Trichonephila inaurata madagascariensis TaxID=2747483 RepID=A0A8X6YPS7_9ARAC|nr:uncharacterized protein TNIN_339091 [Trichonephila inaurata madagascariensis]
MQLWFLISIGGVLFGFVACDPECYEKESNECKQEQSHHAQDDLGLRYCGVIIKHQKCLIEAAKGCKMNFVPELEKVLFITKENCKPGSEINKGIADI